MNTIAAVWFTCQRDFGTLLLSIASVRYHYPDVRCLVVSDARRGLTGEMIRVLEERGVRIKQGPNHGGNLRSLECITNILHTIRTELEHPDVFSVLKIDSDTAWLKEQHPTYSTASQVGSFSGKLQGRWPWNSGGAYFVNKCALEVLPGGSVDDMQNALLAMDRARASHYSTGWSEDQAVSALLDHRGGALVCFKEWFFTRWGFAGQGARDAIRLPRIW